MQEEREKPGLFYKCKGIVVWSGQVHLEEVELDEAVDQSFLPSSFGTHIGLLRFGDYIWKESKLSKF